MKRREESAASTHNALPSRASRLPSPSLTYDQFLYYNSHNRKKRNDSSLTPHRSSHMNKDLTPISVPLKVSHREDVAQLTRRRAALKAQTASLKTFSVVCTVLPLAAALVGIYFAFRILHAILSIWS